jgi:hypothetical protein
VIPPAFWSPLAEAAAEPPPTALRLDQVEELLTTVRMRFDAKER